MTDYALSEAGWENEEHRYPNDKPYALREQHQRAPGELTKVLLCDVVDVLDEMVQEYQRVMKKAEALVDRAEELDEDDEEYFEHLQWILEEAENLDHIRINWDGDSGMVTVSISDYWYEVEDAMVVPDCGNPGPDCEEHDGRCD